MGAHDHAMGTEPSTDAAAGQVSTAAAEVYEQFFVPALFRQFAEPMLDVVAAGDGDRLLDVGAGTGVVGRAALKRVGGRGSVVAVDPNEGMLTVAERLAPAMDTRRGVAEQLPVDRAEMNCVTCQFALMFFSDRRRAVEEMRRVLRPGGRVAVATWASVGDSPGYAAMVELLEEEIGDWAADALRAPFCLGTPGADRRRDATVVRRRDGGPPRGSGSIHFPRRLAVHRDPGVDARRTHRRRPVRAAAAGGSDAACALRHRRRGCEIRGACTDSSRIRVSTVRSGA